MTYVGRVLLHSKYNLLACVAWNLIITTLYFVVHMLKRFDGRMGNAAVAGEIGQSDRERTMQQRLGTFCTRLVSVMKRSHTFELERMPALVC